MVLLYSQRGQLANRLWQAAYFISNAVENNYTLLHLGFAEYAIYFKENKNFPLNKGKIRFIDFENTSKKDRLLIKYANLSKGYNETHKRHYPLVDELYFFENSPGDPGYNLSQKAFLNKAKNKMLLVDGWQFVDHLSLKKHKERIRQIFTPNEDYLENIETLKQKSYANYEVVIGVHIRRGDYSTFNNGSWFFSNFQYISFLKQVILLPQFKNKTIGFLLCSDEKINYQDFEELNIIRSTNHFIEDLYSLSFCDLIIGPPSTFSAWASFYGNKPLLQFNSTVSNITEDQFAFAL